MAEVADMPTVFHDKLITRAARQLAREQLLIESSDWPFLVTTGQAKDYAVERFNEHVERFNLIYNMIKSGAVNEASLAKIEDTDSLFQEIDLSHFSKKSMPKPLEGATKN